LSFNENKNWFKKNQGIINWLCLLYSLIISTILIVVISKGWIQFVDCRPTLKIGYFSGAFLLIVSLLGFSLKEPHLNFYNALRIMFYSAILIIVITLLYSMALDFIDHLTKYKITS
jgi:hypothetical protein